MDFYKIYKKNSKGLGVPVKSPLICVFRLAFSDNNHRRFETLPSVDLGRDLGTLFHKKP